MKKIVVIGGGASGILAALQAAKNNEVYLIEKNDKIGKKILSTGNGKCNFWNKEININKYNTDNFPKLEYFLNYSEEVFQYLTNELGIYYHEKNGYYYPYSNQASSIREIFEKALIRYNIKIIYNFDVKTILNDKNYKIISNEGKEIICDKIILALGSMAAPKTGSDGRGYELLKQLGYSINKVYPALTSLKSNNPCTKTWAGIRTDAKLTLLANDKIISDERGELQLTNYGISGIVTFNLSSKVAKLLDNYNVTIRIDFLPDISDLKTFFNNRQSQFPNFTIEETLESVFNYKLLNVILKTANLDKNTIFSKLTNTQLDKLITNIKEFALLINEVENYEKAQVCTGGLSLNMINNNFQLINHQDIYVIGELLDVDGICGGYNLAFAFISGYIAGKDI